MNHPTYRLQPVGWVESPLRDRADAPRQGDEGAPVARVVFRPEFREAAGDLRAGDEMLVLTWLHQGRRDVLSVQGVFTTRSPDRPNPIGLHAVVIERVEENAIEVRDLEAIDGTPVLDIKPILGRRNQR